MLNETFPVIFKHRDIRFQDQRPKRSILNSRAKKQLEPGVYSCGHQGNDMFVNFINPRYPGPDTAAGTCHFRLLKHSPDICQVRVDFVDTELLSPRNGICNEQYLLVTGTVFENHPKCRIWIFLILALSSNFCPDLSGNSVWPQASGFQNLAQMDHFWHF